VRDAGQHQAIEIAGDRVQSLGLLGRTVREEHPDVAGLYLAHDRQVGQALAVVGYPVHQVMTEAAELVGVHPALPSWVTVRPRVAAVLGPIVLDRSSAAEGSWRESR